MNKVLLLLTFMLFSCASVCALEEDFLVEETLRGQVIQKPIPNLSYNYEDPTRVPVKLKITQKIKSEKELYEGQILTFNVAENVRHDGKMILRKGSTVVCQVETIISNGMNGIPASVVLGNFKTTALSSGQLDKTFEKYGRDLSLIVFPLKWALTILPPTGSLTNFIMGGHAKFKPSSAITVYYYPNRA